LKVGSFAIAEEIIKNQEELLQQIENDNCLLTLTIHHEAIINHKEETISLKYVVNAGSQSIIKEINFMGLTSVSETYLKKATPLKPNTCFQRTKILKARKKLQSTGLFVSTTPDIPDEVNDKGEVPIIFNLKERKHRSIKTGLSYGNDLGAGVNLGWEHRNFFSNAEKVSINTFINKKEQLGKISYVEPFFMRDDQKLKASLSGENTLHRAFSNKEGKLFVGIERKLREKLDAGVGGKITLSESKEKNHKREKFFLFSTPTFLRLNKRDNILNPQKGYFLFGQTEPFIDIDGDSKPFLKNTIRARYYFKAHENLVVAFRGTIGSILGDNASKIPPTERYFAGGNSSIRGYAFQSAGPLDENRLPIGGKSIVETTAELRFNIIGNIGLAIFTDSGSVYRKHLPNSENKFFHSVGFGLRYDTGFGPIRADIAFPTKRRKRIDDPFQFYFGIGQSF